MQSAVHGLVVCVVLLLTSAVVVHLYENTSDVLVDRSKDVWLVRGDVCKNLHLVRPDREKVSLLIVDECGFGGRAVVLLVEDVLDESDTEVVG